MKREFGSRGELPKGKHPIGIGTLHPRFESVYGAFISNFDGGWESQGANFAAFVDGELVVDLWGGYADRSCNWTFEADTLSTIYSCSKAVASMCIAKLVEEGRISYDDCVSKYWREYGKNGKEHTTLLNVLHHQAGIPYLREEDGRVAILKRDRITSVEKMDELVERQTPLYTPGTQSAYHPLTFGWIIDGLIRRIDLKQRNTNDFLRQEIIKEHDIELYFGGCHSVEHRLSRLTSPRNSPLVSFREWIYNPIPLTRVIVSSMNPRSTIMRSFRNVYGVKDLDVANHPDTRELCQPAYNGVSNARSIARLLDLFEGGKIVSDKTLEALRSPVIYNKYDDTQSTYLSKGHGFVYNQSPLGDWQYGHMGVGGQNLKTDTKHRITFAYLTNGMKAGQEQSTRTMKRLEDALYACYADMKDGEDIERRKTQ